MCGSDGHLSRNENFKANKIEALLPKENEKYNKMAAAIPSFHTEKWVIVYRKKPSFQVSFLMVTSYFYFNPYHHSIFIYICIYHTNIYTTYTCI